MPPEYRTDPDDSLIVAGNGLWDADERGITPIERKFSIRVRMFCRHSCHKRGVNALYLSCKESAGSSRGVHTPFVTRMTSAERWYLWYGKTSASVFRRPKKLTSRSFIISVRFLVATLLASMRAWPAS